MKGIKINKNLLRSFKKIFENDFILRYTNDNCLYFISLTDNFIKINDVNLNLEKNVFYMVENQNISFSIYNSIVKNQKIKIDLLENDKISINDYEVNYYKLNSKTFIFEEIFKLKNKVIINEIIENLKMYKQNFKNVNNYCVIYNIDKKDLIFNCFNKHLNSFYVYDLNRYKDIEIKQDLFFYVNGLSFKNKLFKLNLSYSFKEMKIFQLNEQIYFLEFNSKNYGFGFFVTMYLEDLKYDLFGSEDFKKLKNKNIILEKYLGRLKKVI